MKNKNLLKFMRNKRIATSIICATCVGTLCVGCGSKDTGTKNQAPENEIITNEIETTQKLDETQSTQATEPTKVPTQTNQEPQEAETTKNNSTTTTNDKTNGNTTTKKEENKTQQTTSTSKTETKPSGTANKTESNKTESNKVESNKNESSHSHKWVAITKTVSHDAEYKTVTHEAEYKTERVCVEEAWTEEVTERGTFCKGCWENLTKGAQNSGTEINEYVSQHMLNHKKNDGIYYRDIYTERVVDTINHPAVYEDRRVKVKDAWTETVTTGYKCSCGATK